MTQIHCRQELLIVLAVLVCAIAVPARSASAAIIGIQRAQTCSVYGLDASPSAAVGGVHCDPASVGPYRPFSLTELLNGSISVFVGDSATPSWNLVNDTANELPRLTLYYSGALASNSFIDLQVRDPFLSAGWIARPDITGKNPSLPLEMTWSGGTPLARNQVFNLWTASFAHAGADAGCISGTVDCKPVTPPTLPDGAATVTLLGLALAGMRIAARSVK